MGGKLSPEKKRISNERYRTKHPNADHDWHVRNREKALEADRQYHERNRELVRAKAREHYSKNPLQWKAEAIAKRMPIGSKCEFCGSTENLQRHHPSYEEPTKFITVCCTCHRRIHQGKWVTVGCFSGNRT